MPLKARIAYENDKVEKALNIYTQILQADPANYVMLCNMAMVKLKMRKFKEALFDIETAIEANKTYDDAWYLSLMAHLSLGNKKGTEQDIRHIRHNFVQEKAFKVINEYVNKLEHFDVEWFRLFVDSYPYKAIVELNDINQWRSLCNHQYVTDDYTRWYNTAATWYNKYNNTKDNHMNVNAFFEKVYYMHKSKGLHFTWLHNFIY